MDIKEIEHFLKITQISLNNLKKAENWEIEFVINRAKELKIKGMEEYIKSKTGRMLSDSKKEPVKRGRPPKKDVVKKTIVKETKDELSKVETTPVETIVPKIIVEENSTTEVVETNIEESKLINDENSIILYLANRLDKHKQVGLMLECLLEMKPYISEATIDELSKELYNSELICNYLEKTIVETKGVI